MFRYRFVIGFVLGMTVTVAAAVLASSAVAQSGPSVDCALILGGGGLDEKWEVQMTAWLAQGKTKFVSNPSGVCAY